MQPFRNGTRCCRIPEVVRTVTKEARYIPSQIPTTTHKGGDIISNDSSTTQPSTDDDDNTSTGEIETTTIKLPEPGPGPVGDCPCGATQMKESPLRVLAQDTGGVHRPWLVHINIEKDSGEPVECTGSLLNL